MLVLEAGAESAARGLTVRVQGMTVLKRRRQLHKRAGVRPTADPNAEFFEELAPGGLSNHWSCAVPRFSPEDFEDARRGGEASTWPLDYPDLAPWYDRVEPLLNIAGDERGSAQLPAGRVRKAWSLHDDWASVASEASQRGRTVGAMPYAYGAETTVTFSGTVFNSFVRLIQPSIRSGRLDVRYDARVVRLEYSARERRVTGVVFRDARTGQEGRVGCRAVVLSAGAISTPEILLNSTSADFPNGLGNTHGVLGRYLHDHPIGKVVVDLGKPISVHPPSYITRPTLPHAATPLYAAACMQWSGANMLAKSVLARTPGKLRYLGYSVFGTMAPEPDQFVALDPGKTGERGAPGLILNIDHPPDARIALEKARDDLVDMLTAAGWDPRVRVWKIENAGNSNHYAGSCRMHASPQYGMLDGFSRAHAVRNLVVADSSVFTTGPEKNPVLTSMALAARASDRLAADLRSGDL